MNRTLAVVAAVAMVAVSLALRSRLDRKEQEQTEVLRLVCATELAPVCDRLRRRTDVRLETNVEPAGTTADRLAEVSGDDAGLDGWLVSAPWPKMVEENRRAAAQRALFVPTDPPLARSPLVIVMWNDRAKVLAARCQGEPVGWRCISEATLVTGGWPAIGGKEQWGQVKPGVADPVTDGIGLQVAGQVAAALLGRTDVSTHDLDDAEFDRRFTSLAGAVRRPGAPLIEMMVKGAAAYDAVGAIEAEAGPLVAKSSRRDSLEVLYPSTMATADVVVATTGERGSRLRELMNSDEGKQALSQAGWRVPGYAAVEGVRAGISLPGDAGLPPPGLLDALRHRWEEATG